MRGLAAEGLWGLAHVAGARGLPEGAGGLAGAALAFGEPAGFDPVESISFAHHLDEARSALGEEAWQKAVADGAELGFDAALALTRALDP
jgi:hypothetical protein